MALFLFILSLVLLSIYLIVGFIGIVLVIIHPGKIKSITVSSPWLVAFLLAMSYIIWYCVGK